MRLIDADALAHDLEHDVELCARALDDMNLIGKERKNMQFDKDCKQNCIWYISEQPTVDAVPVIRCRDCKFLRFTGTVWKCQNRLVMMLCEQNDYCSRAERKEE